MDDPETVMRRRQGQTIPIWFGVLFAVVGGTFFFIGLPIIGAEGLPFPASLLFSGVGALFAIVGIALVIASIRQARRAVDPRALLLPVARASADGRYHFQRPVARVALDTVGAPVGAIVFLAGAVVFSGQIGSDGRAIVGVAAFGFFGLLMAAGAVTTLRQGIHRDALVVGSDGVWTAASGLLRWSSVRAVRIEDAGLVRSGVVRSRVSGYRRIAIDPRDARLADRAPGGVARGLVQGYVEFLRRLGPRARLNDPAALSPFGVYEFELSVPLETIVPVIAPHVPVLGVDGRFVRPEDEARFPDRPDLPHQPSPTRLPGASAGAATSGPGLSAADVRRIDASIGSGPVASSGTGPTAPNAGLFSTPSIRREHPPIVATSEASLQRTVSFDRRAGSAVGALWVVWRSVTYVLLPPVVIAAMSVAVRPPWGIVLVMALIASVFVIAGLGPLLEAIVRLRLERGPSTVLTVGPEGIGIHGRPPIPWAEIMAVRLEQTHLVEGDEGDYDRPRLEIVPRDPRRLEERSATEREAERLRERSRVIRFWDRRPSPPAAFRVDLDTLDANPDDVIDLVDLHRRVEVVG